MSRALLRRSLAAAEGSRLSLWPEASFAVVCASAAFSTTTAARGTFKPSAQMLIRPSIHSPRFATHRSSVASLETQKACLFTNAKKSYARGTEEEQKAREEAAFKESRDFLKQQVDADGRNAPRSRDIENRLPSKKQLNEELPSTAELEKALREGKMDMYATKPEKDEE